MFIPVVQALYALGMVIFADYLLAPRIGLWLLILIQMW